MSNMSYCRFRNTLGDLRDCESALDDLLSGENDALSDDELDAAKRLVALCARITLRVCEDLPAAENDVLPGDFLDSMSERGGTARTQMEMTLDGANQERKDELHDIEMAEREAGGGA